MKGNFKKIIACVAVGAVLLTTPSLAKETTEKLTAVYQNIKLIVDGASIEPKDANGTVVEPFIYNGTTYLPVRAVANAFGKEVDWDGDNSIVYLGAHSGKPAKELTLWNRSYTECSDSKNIVSKDNKGVGYIKCSFSGTGTEITPDRYYMEKSITYPINALAKKVKGEFYITGSDEVEGVLKICNSNGKVLYTSPIMRTSTKPVKFDVNVEKEITVKFIFEATGDDWYSSEFYINNPVIVSADY